MTTQFWIAIQTLASDAQPSSVTMDALCAEYTRSSDEVREQMRLDLETAIGRLIMIDRTLNAKYSQYAKD